jgi:hypothetical protein
MRTNRLPPVVLLSAVLLTGFGLGVVAVGQAPGAAPAEDPKALAVQYATVYRDLAKLDYDKVASANRVVPGVISQQTLRTLQFSLLYGESILDEATQESKGAAPNPLRFLELCAANTKATYDAALQSRRGDASNEIELERLRLQSELFRLRLAKAKASLSLPLVDQLADRVDMLQEELVLLSQQVARLAVQPSR